jgi:hypothetical protein
LLQGTDKMFCVNYFYLPRDNYVSRCQQN